MMKKSQVLILLLLAVLLASRCAKKQEVKTGGEISTRETRVEEGELRTESPGGQDFEYGYRVQLYATKDVERAREVALSARKLLGENTYVEFQEPWYKVRLGDYRSRDEAERVRYRASTSGFADAWVVETTIRTGGSLREGGGR
jgi:cell division septation protein DedD